MKIVIFLLLFCFIPSAKLYAQQTEEEAIDTLLKTTQKFRKEFQKLSLNKGSINKYPYEEVLEGARALYKFNRNYPKSRKIFEKEYDFSINQQIKGSIILDSLEKYPGAQILLLDRQIGMNFNNYENDFITSIDGVIIGKILNEKTVVCELSPYPSMDYVIFEIEIDEILEGMNEYKKGDKIEIWTAYVWGGGAYSVGKTYLFNLWYRAETNKYNTVVTPQISIYSALGSGHGVFEVENNTFIDRTNYFGFGYKVEFKSIKNYIIDLRNKLLLTE